jgi:2-polyprenyl-6-methoxyphenol hydroxylase-like FAD-dependent oxidoreductase
MKIVCIGGGPAGLYFGLLMKMRNPAHDITVVERNKPYDTFGWGVVFSDATMDNMRQWDPVTASEIQQAFNHWDDIELEFKGEVIRSGGHGFVGIGRKKLLNILQERCEQLGVNLVFDADVESDEDFPDADLIIASDGIFSKIRTKYEAVFKPDIVVRPTATSGWARTNSTTRSPSCSRRRARLVPGAYLQVRRDHHHLHRRMPRARLAGAQTGSGGPGRVHRLLRKGVREEPAGRQADDQRAPPARLGLAQFPARQVRAVVAV